MIEEVRSLYNQGYSLLPLVGKRPPTGFFWEALQRERASLSQVESWFSQPYNVGIICGKISGIVVLDIDPRNGGVVSEWLNKYPTDKYVLTGSGGAHLYYKHPGYQVENIHPAPGVDLKGDGGYVVAPPSVHPETNRGYSWVSNGEPAPFPSEILSQNAKPEQSNNSWISTLLESGSADGQKNDSLASISGYFASKEIPKDITKAVIKLWNQRNQSKIDIREIETSVNSVYKTAKRREVVLPQTPMEMGTFVGDKRFRLQGFEDFMRTYADTPIDWIVPGWMPDKTIAFLISPPGTFKTWLLLDLAVSCAMGSKFLNLYPTKLQGPVFLVQQEDWAGQTAQRIEVIRQSKVIETVTQTEDEITMDLPKNIPLYVHTDRQLNFDDKIAIEGLVESVKEIRPRLVIIDPLYSAATTEDYMAAAAKQMFVLKEMRDKYGTTFVVAHHSNKGVSEDRTRAWGSQFLNAFLETGWQVYPKGKKSIKIKRHFKAAGNPAETCLSFDINTETGFSYHVTEGLIDSKNEENEMDEDEVIKPKTPQNREVEKEPSVIMDESDVNPLVIEPKKGRGFKDILEFLNTKTDWISAKEVADYFEEPVGKMTNKLDKMMDQNLIKRRFDDRKTPGWKKQYKLSF